MLVENYRITERDAMDSVVTTLTKSNTWTLAASDSSIPFSFFLCLMKSWLIISHDISDLSYCSLSSSAIFLHSVMAHLKILPGLEEPARGCLGYGSRLQGVQGHRWRNQNQHRLHDLLGKLIAGNTAFLWLFCGLLTAPNLNQLTVFPPFLFKQLGNSQELQVKKTWMARTHCIYSCEDEAMDPLTVSWWRQTVTAAGQYDRIELPLLFIHTYSLQLIVRSASFMIWSSAEPFPSLRTHLAMHMQQWAC